MARIPLPSSVLAAAEYFPELLVLDIAFKTSEVYRHWTVPLSLYQDLLEADSKGTFFNTHIRNRFSFQHLDSAEHSAPRPIEN